MRLNVLGTSALLLFATLSARSQQLSNDGRSNDLGDIGRYILSLECQDVLHQSEKLIVEKGKGGMAIERERPPRPGIWGKAGRSILM